MSDDESVISEDIDYSSDGGDEGGDFQYDESDIVQPTTLHTKKKTDPPAPLPTPHSSSSYNKKLEPAISSSKYPGKDTTADEDYNDEYSTGGFEEVYSNDFEDVDGAFGTGISRISHVSQKVEKDGVRGDGKLDGVTKSSSLFQVQFPSIATVPLQAEIALEQISKEVIRLRNQQRNLLHERRQAAREKKQRAESRRAQYQVELRDLKSKQSQSETDCANYASKVESLQRTLDSVISSKDILISDLDLKEHEITEFKAKMTRMQSEIDQCKHDLAASHSHMEQREEEWETEKAALKAEITRSSMMASVVQQSLEANEVRLTRERERLPEDHRRLLDEQVARNKALEGSLLEREGILRAEEARRVAALDQRVREATEDIARQRTRMESDLDDERASLRDQKQQLDHERQRMESQFSKERALVAASSMDLSRRESAMAEEQRAIDRARGDLDASKMAIEPILRATNADRDAARRGLDNAEGVLREAEERAAAVMGAEKGLMQLERDIQAREAAAEDMRIKYTAARKVLQVEAGKLLVSQKSSDAERFRLHSAAMELASQAVEVRHVAGMTTKQGRLTSSARAEEIRASVGGERTSGNKENIDTDFPLPMLSSLHQLDHIASSMQSLAEGLAEPPRAHAHGPAGPAEIISPIASSGVHWLPESQSTFKPFRDVRISRPLQDFDDDDTMPVYAVRQRRPAAVDYASERPTRSDLGGELSAVRSSWPIASSLSFPQQSTSNAAVTTMITRQSQDEQDALYGSTLRVSIDSASESAKSLKDYAAKYGVYAH